jgi:hypothetical protein
MASATTFFYVGRTEYALCDHCAAEIVRLGIEEPDSFYPISDLGTPDGYQCEVTAMVAAIIEQSGDEYAPELATIAPHA